MEAERLSQKEFEKLALIRDIYCTSIYIPASNERTKRTSGFREVFESSLQGAAMILLQYGLNSKDVHDLLNVAKGIWKETQFDNRAEGFVILLNSRKVSYFGFGPIEESLVYVADHFYLAPLLPLYPFNKDIKIEQIKAEWSECLKSVLPAAVEGKVQTLFLAKGIDIYGLYDRHNEILLIDEKKTINNISLFNLIAVNTHLHGGQVYFLDQEEMPAKFSKIKAVFRS